MADVDEDQPINGLVQAELDLTDETQDFRFLLNLSRSVADCHCPVFH